jgi:hypothetical protein
VDDAQRLQQISWNAAVYGLTIHTGLFFNATSASMITNDICRHVEHGRWWTILGWVNSGSSGSSSVVYGGRRTFNDVPCDEWHTESAHVNRSMCVAVDGSELPLTVTLFNKRTQKAQIMEFATLERREPPHSELTLPHSCTVAPELCPARGNGVDQLDAFIFHPREHYNISDQDVADARGDVFFTCFDVLSGGTAADSYAVISWYALELDNRYTVYSMCNGYSPPVCLGPAANGANVGREAALAASNDGRGGQCSANDDVGNWYALPAQGLCLPGDTLGVTCHWRSLKRVKTIESKCLMETQQLLQVCKTMRPPFTKGLEIWRRAFASDVIADGGCPPVQP